MGDDHPMLTFLPPNLFDAAEKIGEDMTFFRRQEPIPTADQYQWRVLDRLLPPIDLPDSVDVKLGDLTVRAKVKDAELIDWPPRIIEQLQSRFDRTLKDAMLYGDWSNAMTNTVDRDEPPLTTERLKELFFDREIPNRCRCGGLLHFRSDCPHFGIT